MKPEGVHIIFIKFSFEVTTRTQELQFLGFWSPYMEGAFNFAISCKTSKDIKKTPLALHKIGRRIKT